MGQCSSKNSVGVVESINLVENEDKNQNLNSKRVNSSAIKNQLKDYNFENVRIFISYCWSDKEVSHALADKFVKEKFQLSIDREKTSPEDLFFAMDHSDFVLLFISKSYINCSECQREARYAFDQNLEIVIVNLNSSYVLDKWIAQIIGGRKSAFLLDSKNFCSYSFEDIKENILKVIQKQKNAKGKPLVRMPDETELSKRKLAYNDFKNKEIQKDKKKVEESKEHIDKVFEVSQNNYKKNAYLLETPGILNWILKYPLLTIKNLMPFSPNGDVNTAVFEIPISQERLKRSYQPFGCDTTNKIVRKKRPNACRLAFEATLSKKITNMKLKEDATHIYFAKLIERPYALNTGLSKGASAWFFYTAFIGPELKSEKEIQRRKRLDSNLNIHKKTRQRLSKYFEEKEYYFSKEVEPDSFEKFAKRMKQNTIDFETFCSNWHSKVKEI